MTWADAVPNLLIGLREGLEGGLVVSILLGAVRKTDAPEAGNRPAPTAPVWLGVLGAVMVAGSFAAVLTFRRGSCPARRLRPALRGGYFYTLPGVAQARDWCGRALLS